MSRSVVNSSTATTCPYCGVGCGVIASLSDNGVTIKGDPDHPANFGRLCSKGSALSQTIDADDRLLKPVVDGQECDWDQALTTVADGFGRVIDSHGADAVAMYVSGQLLTEDYYVANKLMKGFIGSANIDTNSRLCMSSSVAGHKRAFGSDTVPCCYEDLDRARLIVLAGSNTAWCHPVLYQRIAAAKRRYNDMTVVVIDPRKTATCDIADLHLPLKPGSDAMLYNGLLAHLDKAGEIDNQFVSEHTEGYAEALAVARDTAPDIEAVARGCGLPVAIVSEFFRLFTRTERVITVYSQGINQSSSGSDKVNAIINCHLLTGRIGRIGMGPFSFTGQPNAMGGREVGGLANMLAAHMELDNSEHRRIIQTFWRSPVIADKAGFKAVDLFKAIGDGRVKAVWIMATNPAFSLPDADSVRTALDKCEFVVVSDAMRVTDTTQFADVLLPAQTWGEKNGSVTNSERRISRQRAFLQAPGEARPDWWIITEVAKRMGYTEAFDYHSPAQIFREHAQLSGVENEGERDFDIAALSQISDLEYAELKPVQWPVYQGQGTARMFSDRRFFTPTGKARFVSVIPRPPKHAVNDDFPLTLNTGRVRDHWHSMTRSGKSPRLSEHSPEPYVEIHPFDVAAHGLQDDGLAQVFSRWGEVLVRVRADDCQCRGSVFVPMHWNDQHASHARIDSVVNPVVDPVSGQPESKQTPVRVIPYPAAWQGFILSRRRLDLDNIDYWVRAQGAGYYRYEIAGKEKDPDWPAWARSVLCQSDNDVNWIEYHDVRGQRYRGVRMVASRVESCIFIAPSAELPPRNWLGKLFEHEALSQEERRGLLSGRPPAGQTDIGRIVCACFSVGVNTITTAIEEQQLTSVEAIGEALRAGTNCGSCIPELQTLLGTRG